MPSIEVNKKTAQEKAMSNDDIKRLVLRYSIPTILGMLINALYNVVDRYWVGGLEGDAGLYGLTGIGLVMPAMTIFLATGQLVGMGAAAFISMTLGKGDRKLAEQALGTAFSLIVSLSLFVTLVFLFFKNGLLNQFGADENTFAYANDYFTIILIGAAAHIISLALNHCIRATGNTKRFASTQILGAVINIILDPIFIYGFDMGVKGAALATVIAYFASAAWVLSYFFSKNTAIRLKRGSLTPKAHITKRITAIGLSPFLMHVMGSLITVIVNRSLKHYGELELSDGSVAIGAFTVINSISMLFLMPMIGINQGSQPIIGYNYGAGNYERVKTALKWAVIYSVSVCTAGFVVTQAFSAQLVRAFNDDAQLIEAGAYGIRIFLFALPVIGFQLPAAGFFQSIGRARMSITLTLLRQCILLVPLYFILPPFLGLNGIWYANPIADITAAGITFLCIRKCVKSFPKSGAEVEFKA